MFSTSTWINTSPENLFLFICDTANFEEIFASKYDIKYEEDDTAPSLGRVTNFSGGIDGITVRFTSEVVEFEPNQFLTLLIKYQDIVSGGEVHKIEMPDIAVRHRIAPKGDSSKLTISMVMTSHHSLWKKIYYFYSFLREYGELRRYIRYVQEKLEQSKSACLTSTILSGSRQL